MAGIYFHIPYCKTKCPYCDFFSVTRRKDKHLFIDALLKEIGLQKSYLQNQRVNSLYFGGGTPSLLDTEKFKRVLDKVYNIFNVSEHAEITLECNPDDVTPDYFRKGGTDGFNRLSLGIQSFHDKELDFLGRRHTVRQNDQVIQWALEEGFSNISIDLIYGLPSSTPERWEKTLEMAFGYPIKHLSAYHLTIEPETVFGKMLYHGDLSELPEEDSLEQFRILVDYAQSKGFEHYELSGFAMPGYYSRHNTGYWMQEPYLGLGPSAHSYNGKTRQWNVSHIGLYIESVIKGQVPYEEEFLTTRDHFNEYLITRLRTQWGVNFYEIKRAFGEQYKNHLLRISASYLDQGYLQLNGDTLTLTRAGKFISDAIFRELIVSKTSEE